MLARFIATALVVLAVAASAGATEPKENLQVFRAVQRQVLQYPHFTIFDSVSAQVDNGTVTLVGKVTMPYKKNDIERHVRRLTSVEHLVNKTRQRLDAASNDHPSLAWPRPMMEVRWAI